MWTKKLCAAAVLFLPVTTSLARAAESDGAPAVKVNFVGDVAFSVCTEEEGRGESTTEICVNTPVEMSPKSLLLTPGPGTQGQGILYGKYGDVRVKRV